MFSLRLVLYVCVSSHHGSKNKNRRELTEKMRDFSLGHSFEEKIVILVMYTSSSQWHLGQKQATMKYWGAHKKGKMVWKRYDG